MSITALEPTYSTTAGQASRAGAKDKLGRDQFMTLLVAQLKYQDPLNPMESADFTAQLAQFSSLEQLFNINDNLEILQGRGDTDSIENLLDYIGKEVRWPDNNVIVGGGVASGGSYELPQRGDVVISIFDDDGFEIRRIYRKDQSVGKHNLDFDGKDGDGRSVPDGNYSFAVEAVDAQGRQISVKSGLTGLVSAVTYKGDVPYLVCGDHIISPANVIEVRLAQPAEGEGGV